MTRTKTIAFAAASMLLIAPAFAQDTATPSGRSDSTSNGAMKSDSMKSGDMMKSDGMKTNSMKSGSSSEQGSSTPAGDAANTEKKM